MQDVAEGADVGLNFIEKFDGFVESFVEAGSGASGVIAGGRERHVDGGDFLGGDIVEVASDFAAFGILNVEDTSGESAQRGFAIAQSVGGFDQVGGFDGGGADGALRGEVLGGSEGEADNTRLGFESDANFTFNAGMGGAQEGCVQRGPACGGYDGTELPSSQW